MKLKLLPIILLAVTNFAFAQQTGSFWKTSSKGNITKQENKLELPLENIFELDIEGLKTVLANSPQRNPNAKSTPTIVSIPNSEGKMERFYVSENSTMSPELQAKYPEIRSYIGTGVDNTVLTAHFSNTPLGFKSMVLGADRAAVFIEPISSDLKIYTVYKKSDKREGLSKFECTTKDHLEGKLNKKKAH